MHRYLQSLVLLKWTQSVTSSPFASSSSNQVMHVPYLQASITNLSVPEVPSSFKIRPSFYLPAPEPPEAYFLNAMTAMQEAALGDFNGNMSIGSFHSPRFPQPNIRPVVLDETSIPRKYMVWGVYLAMAYMHFHNQYGICAFALQNGPNDVGVIGFGVPPVGASSASLSTGTIAPVQQVLVGLDTQTGGIELMRAPAQMDDNGSLLLNSWATPAITNKTTATATLPSNLTLDTIANITASDRDLDVIFTYLSPPFDKITLLHTLLNAIADTAIRAYDASVPTAWRSFLLGEECQFIVTGMVPLRKGNPVLEYQDLARALVKTADWMIGQGTYGETTMVVKINEKTVANAGILPLPPPDDDVGRAQSVARRHLL